MNEQTQITGLSACDSQDGHMAVSVLDCKILVIEDSEPIRQVIGAYLKTAGLINYEFANDGRVGLEYLETFRPDLIILDIRMPNMDGYEFLREMRANPRFSDLPVLVQTAYSDAEERNKAFHAGGTDLISKPINGVELLARVMIHLENRMLVRRLTAYQNRIQDELNSARQMQEALLPQPHEILEIESEFQLDIQNFFEPSSELGGDFWNVQRLDDHRVGVAMADFTGHGVNSAMNTFRLHTLMGSKRMRTLDPALYLQVLNKKLVKLMPTGQFATMFYGIIDTKSHTLTYAGAASTSPVLGCVDRQTFAFHDASGLPLGIAKEAIYENRTVDFPSGSFLFLYSDALVETNRINKDQLEEAGLGSVLQRGLARAVEKHPFSYVLECFDSQVTRPLPDDLTAIWLSRI